MHLFAPGPLNKPLDALNAKRLYCAACPLWRMEKFPPLCVRMGFFRFEPVLCAASNRSGGDDKKYI